MHKAIAMIQFKLEGALAKEHPDFHMENRCVLEGIDPVEGTVQGRTEACMSFWTTISRPSTGNILMS